jgi:signal peptidase II
MRLFLFLSLPLLLLDIVTKEWILQRFGPPPPYESIVVVPGFFEITRVHNTGVAFGMGNGTTWSNLLFGVIAVLAFFGIAWMWRKGHFPNAPGRLAAALLLAGIPGNLQDRLRHGYVVDFLDFDLGFMRWPAFNVADSCITIAAVLLLVSAFLPENAPPRPSASRPDPQP